MSVNRGSGLLLGLVAALVMTLIMVILRAAEFSDLNLEMMNGALLTGSVGVLTWLTGFAMHLVAGGGFALIYAAAFEAWGGAGWARGVLLALPHTLLSGTLMGVLPLIHPAIQHEALRSPGFLGAGFGGATVAVLVALHVVFGIIVGGGYRVRAPARRAAMSHGPS